MPLLFYINSITALFPCICLMSDETRQNKSKRDKMRQDIKMLIIATILQPDNSKIQYLCPFPAIIHLLEGNLIYPLRGNLPYRAPLKRQSNKMQILFPSLPYHSQLLQGFQKKNRPGGVTSSRSVAISFRLKLFAPHRINGAVL